MLTDTQKEKIALLRLSGITIKEIASKTGLPFETVKKHLQRHPAELQESHCQNCGAPFKLSAIKKFCSKKCREQFKNKRKKMRTMNKVRAVCLECGNVFYSSKYSKAKFCSQECFQSHESAKWNN